MSNTRQLRSPKGTIRVALTSGHVILITEEVTNVPEIFWAGAYAKGAISGDMLTTSIAEKEAIKKEKVEVNKVAETKELEEVLLGLFDAPKGAIDKNGLPMIRKVSALVGRPVNKPEMLKLWEQLKETEG